MKRTIVLILGVILLCGCSHSKTNTIVMYGDYKCPYCKKVETNIMPKLEENYINKGKAKYKFINGSILGRGSFLGAKAGISVKTYAPKQYLNFQKYMYQSQPQSSKQSWLQKDVIDKNINKLHVTDKTKDKIKHDYKKQKGRTYQKAKHQHKQIKDKKISQVPTVFINGKQVHNPYDYKEYQRLLH